VLGTEQRLTKLKYPQTNEMLERFNGRLAHVLKSNRFPSAYDMETAL
jgi:transposase InsO family protein